MLTVKQQKFADAYIASGNATESAIKAGYSKKTACAIGTENLRKPNIKKYIDEKLEEIASENILTMTEAMEILTTIARGQPHTIKILNDFGEKVDTEVYPSFKERLGALEQFHKRNGAYIDRKDITVDSDLTIEIDYGED